MAETERDHLGILGGECPARDGAKDLILSEAQVGQIACVIDSILRKARKSLENLDSLYDQDYIHARKTESLTGLVYSAFPSGSDTVSGLEIKKRRYGCGLTLPELHVDGITVQLYNSTARPYRSTEVVTRLRESANELYLLEFTVDTDSYELLRLDLVRLSGTTGAGGARIARRKHVYIRGPRQHERRG